MHSSNVLTRLGDILGIIVPYIFAFFMVTGARNGWASSGAPCISLEHPEALIAATLAHQDLERSPQHRYALAISLASLLPKVSVRVGESDGKGNFLNIAGDSPDRQDQSSYVSTRWQVRASWDFSRLLFDKSRFPLETANARHHRLRRQLIDEVLKLAGQLRAVKSDAEGRRRSVTAPVKRWYLRARIRALTGRQLCERQVRARLSHDDNGFRTTRPAKIPRGNAH